jgi:hypothetical protein
LSFNRISFRRNGGGGGGGLFLFVLFLLLLIESIEYIKSIESHFAAAVGTAGILSIEIYVPTELIEYICI